MPLNFSNTNLLWASVLVETLYQLGLTTAIICPGSRSAPLAVAFAQHPQIEAIAVLDERSAAFFALGLAKQTGRPVALVCTSGTAGANVYPAVIEARESRIPLLVLTADRPPELRECNAGQTIDQQKLYGTFPNWYSELAVPSLDLSMLAYLRQTMIHSWERSLYPVPGPVHLNLPFRDPLAPTPQPTAQSFATTFPPTFFDSLPTPFSPPLPPPLPTSLPLLPLSLPITQWQATTRGVIIAGIAQPQNPEQYCQAIAILAKILHFPVLAEALSPVRNYANLNPYLVSTYNSILRQTELADKLAPEIVIRIGEMPTSKELRTWLTQTQPQQWVIDKSDRNLDPLHLPTTHLRHPIEHLLPFFSAQTEQTQTVANTPPIPPLPHSPTYPPSPYLTHWLNLETQFRQTLDQNLSTTAALFEGKVAWLLSQSLPSGTPLFIANSTPVRDMEWFWQPGNRAIRPYFNRGANGIDGTLSTALGIAHRHRSTVLLTGDLALLHDTNGFLLRHKLVGHLTIVLINNDGGGIFEMLAIAQFEPPFEEFFGTPQCVDIAALCCAYDIKHERITHWEQLQQRLNPLPQTGIRVLELLTDRKADAQNRKRFLETRPQ